MTDSAAVLDVKLDSGDVESSINTWLTNNSTVTSVDDIEVSKIGPNRGLVTIAYTA